MIVIFSGCIKDIYHLESPLGQGSFGTVVYSATRIVDGLRCALKRIPLPLDVQKRTKFEREAKILHEFDHKHIVKLFLPTYQFKEDFVCKF